VPQDFNLKSAGLMDNPRSRRTYPCLLGLSPCCFSSQTTARQALCRLWGRISVAREIKGPVSIKKWTRNINLAYARIKQSVDEKNPRIA
jgi:hypothetical protein